MLKLFGFDFEAMANDINMTKELNKLIYADNPFSVIYRILKFDITMWKTKHITVNRALTYVYGILYYSVFIGTLLYSFSLI